MKEIMKDVLAGRTMSRETAKSVLTGITEGRYAAEQIAALLTAVQMRGVTVDELLGLRDGILATGLPVALHCERYIDIVGTGGDQKNTFNISTCSCFVVAGAGYKVAKHGNYAATSTSGASNVLEAHGVHFTADADQLNRSIEESGVVYLHAPLFAKAMKHVAPIRKALGFPTCFNLLGPLVNPSQPPCQLLGVATPAQMRLYAEVYKRLGIGYGIVNSLDGYDEVSLTSAFTLANNSAEQTYTPADLGLATATAENLVGGATVDEAKAIFDSVLAGTALADQTNVVVANAAIAIQVLNPSLTLSDAVAAAKESLASGKAAAAFKRFVEING